MTTESLLEPCPECEHEPHLPGMCQELVTRHFGGGSNANGAPYGEWDADDQPCWCEEGPQS